MSTADEFFTNWNNKACNPDGQYGNQCVDVADEYSKDVVGVSLPSVNGAKNLWDSYPADHYDRITNIIGANGNFPLKGDIVIWGADVGGFGHVGICVSADVNHLVTFDQNWPAQYYLDKDGNQIGIGLCHYQTHNYFGILGWLRPKSAIIAQPIAQGTVEIPTITQINDQTKYDFGRDIGVQELGAVRSIINDTKRDLKNAQDALAQLSNNRPFQPITQTSQVPSWLKWLFG